jgi:integrase
MAKIRKRGNSYQIDYFDPNGKRVRKSFRKRKNAEAELGKRVSLIAEGRYLDVKKEYKYTGNQLIDNYIDVYRDQPSFKSSKGAIIEHFKNFFAGDILLSSITYKEIERFKTHYKRLPTRRGTLRGPASINRMLACIHHMFEKALSWDMVEKNPLDGHESLKAKGEKSRLRYLTENEIEHLLDNCTNPYIRDIIIAAINTGMRKEELLSLTWDKGKDGFIYLEKTKSQKPREIPINDDLDELLKNIRRKNQLRSEYVFCDKNGKKFSNLHRSFTSSLRRAKIEDFRFHDLRHTFASHFVMRGGSIKALQEILGHATLAMTMKYAHFSQEEKKKAMNALNGLTTKRKQTVTKMAHFQSNNS